MDSMEVNKWIAAILVAGIAFMVTGFVGEILVHPRELAKPAIEIAGVPAQGGAPAAAQPEAPKAPPILGLLASADTAKGQQVAEANCAVCHTFNQGGGTKIGPNLYGIVGDKRGHDPSFDYTDAFRKLGGTWTYENLNQWLFDPQGVAPGTRMAFAGLKNNKERADVIAWLRTLSPKPLPLPTAEEVKAETEAAQKPAPAPAAAAEQKAAQPAAPSGPNFDALLAKADPAKGKADVEADCTVCHTFGKGEPAKIGPNLYGIVGAPRAHMAGFNYSAGLKKLGGTWTYDNLNKWLTNPVAVVPDTLMAAFPGVKSVKQRADIVAYLRTLSDNPEPLPAAAAEPAPKAAEPQQASPAEGTSSQPATPTPGAAAPQAPAENAAPAAPQPPAASPAPSGAAPATPAEQAAPPATATPAEPQPPAVSPAPSGAAPATPAEQAAPPATATPAGPQPPAASPAPSGAAPATPAEQAAPPATPAPAAPQPQAASPAPSGAAPATPAEQAAPPATTTPSGGNAAPAEAQPEQVSPAREGTSGEQAAPAAGGTSQETPAEKASPGGAGTPVGEPQGGAAGAPAPAQGKP